MFLHDKNKVLPLSKMEATGKDKTRRTKTCHKRSVVECIMTYNWQRA
jgi:hypothetical protein